MGILQSKPTDSNRHFKKDLSTPILTRRIIALLPDPRSPSNQIERTPVQVMKPPDHLVLLSDPRSPTTNFVRTPIVCDKTTHQASITDIRRQLVAFEAQLSVSDISLDQSCSESLGENVAAVTSNTVEAPIEIHQSPVKETEEPGFDFDEKNPTIIVADDANDEDGECSDVEEVVSQVLNEMVATTTEGKQEISTPEYDKELHQIERKCHLREFNGLRSTEDVAVIEPLIETENVLKVRKPKRHNNITKTSKKHMLSSPQRSPLTVINAESSPRVLVQRKQTTDKQTFVKTPQGQQRKRSSMGMNINGVRLMMVNKENM
ncbi:uncharacterized protein LOC100377627 [Saccoglossus kowalevskii]|uniref:Cell division cycle-associated protein 3-like n=1 Tax=Saccoglossus kowalevskii TaxID=10224 RepID=A0ABM0GRT7_SACKO|nr:PREDICTED: cell division cycle-associated protein 3-like [Saccoglossus kowalevskii]